MLKKNMKTTIFILAFLTAFLAKAHAQSHKIDVLVLYDDYANDNLDNQVAVEMTQWFSDINTYFANSGIDASVNLVGTHLVVDNTDAYHYKTILEDTLNSEEVNSLRDQYGADLVMRLADLIYVEVYGASEQDNRDHKIDVSWYIYSQVGSYEGKDIFTFGDKASCPAESLDNDYRVTGDCETFKVTHYGVCGAAYISNRAHYGYSVVDPGCGSFIAAHELGHNLGLSHDRETSPYGYPVESYGRGYGIDSVFATIMAYPTSFDLYHRLPNFSNPEVSSSGYPTGVAIGQPDEAHAAAAINNAASRVAGYRDEAESVPEDPYQACIEACGGYEPGSYSRSMCESYSPACQF